jgi:hypothetical protein
MAFAFRLRGNHNSQSRQDEVIACGGVSTKNCNFGESLKVTSRLGIFEFEWSEARQGRAF